MVNRIGALMGRGVRNANLFFYLVGRSIVTRPRTFDARGLELATHENDEPINSVFLSGRGAMVL